MSVIRLELSIKAIFIGLILTIVFCGANIYLGLKIGNTINASIPAAILAMGFLRLFQRYSILENSIAQTTASVGESMAAVTIFVFPALLILNTWSGFSLRHYCLMFFMVLSGAVIGVIYSIILRNILLNDRQLKFPEGQAIGKVLETTELSKNINKNININKINPLILGMLTSGLTSFSQIGLKILSSGIVKIFSIKNIVFGGAVSFSVAIMGAGFLVGFEPMVWAFLSLLFSWCILLPLFTIFSGVYPHADLIDNAFYIWKTNIRPIGVGVFIFAGFATVIMLFKPIISGLKDSMLAIKLLKINNNKINNNSDLNILKLLVILVITMMPILIFIFHQLTILTHFYWMSNIILSLLIIVILLIVGFGIAAVSGYFAGLAGSTASPISGLLFIAVIIVTLLFNLLTPNYNNHNNHNNYLIETIILLVAFIGGTATITNGTIQDYKSGQIVGSAPYRQQIALFFGVTLAALIAPLFLNLIFNAYGIAGVIPHAGIHANQTLSAPQASAVAALTDNILQKSQNWHLIILGLLIGFIALIIDLIGQKAKKFRCSLISVGMGIYLPPDVVTALFLGSCVRLFINKRQKKIKNNQGDLIAQQCHNTTNLFICGLIAGESLMGLILSIPFVIFQNSNILKILPDRFINFSQVLSIIILLLIFNFIYRLNKIN